MRSRLKNERGNTRAGTSGKFIVKILKLIYIYFFYTNLGYLLDFIFVFHCHVMGVVTLQSDLD